MTQINAIIALVLLVWSTALSSAVSSNLTIASGLVAFSFFLTKV